LRLTELKAGHRVRVLDAVGVLSLSCRAPCCITVGAFEGGRQLQQHGSELIDSAHRVDSTHSALTSSAATYGAACLRLWFQQRSAFVTALATYGTLCADVSFYRKERMALVAAAAAAHDSCAYVCVGCRSMVCVSDPDLG
jgi:hypothetical protein